MNNLIHYILKDDKISLSELLSLKHADTKRILDDLDSLKNTLDSAERYISDIESFPEDIEKYVEYAQNDLSSSTLDIRSITESTLEVDDYIESLESILVEMMSDLSEDDLLKYTRLTSDSAIVKLARRKLKISNLTHNK